MPARRDIETVCVIGSGPIVIGQACEFDYAGCQALKVLREDGYRTIVVNSNPATIMTDPGFADRTYIEPLDLESVADVLARERPDALLPTLGGQTALNLAIALAEAGVLEEFGVELIGAPVDVIRRAEDREEFREAVRGCGLEVPASSVVTSLSELAGVSLPAVVRPAFTLGGHGGGFAEDSAALHAQVERGLAESPIGQVLVEESVRGWDEFELEVIRDRVDNVVIVCSIENLDPMGVHTGDSVTVAPQMTLSDEAYQELRDAAAAVIRAVGVETGGSNIQFARSRETGEVRVIEMNPRVSRSSALASKATGYPIAKVAAKLAVGYTLDEIPNDLTKTTPASFEPTLDYVVVKFPRFAFEKFPGADDALGTQMKSVGEAMGIGRTFTEAYLKAFRSRELEPGSPMPWAGPLELSEAVHPWFREQLESAVEALRSGDLLAAKRAGWGDEAIARELKVSAVEVRRRRLEKGVVPVFRRVDSCAGEVEASSSYAYSTWGESEEGSSESGRPRVVIIGSGPNRIGQGIEFDYCCVHAAQTFRALGYDAVMVNCNPETVSTDYDTSDRLYFEPLTLEDVLEIAHREKPVGAIVQFGGQTPLRLSVPLEKAGLPILGTTPDAIDRAEDRERFSKLIEKLGLKQPENGVARSAEEAHRTAERIGYPAMVRPSYVLGGRAMEVVYDRESLERYIREAVKASPEHPVLIDRFLKDAIEVDLDLVADRTGEVLVGGVLEHIEEAGIHSGDAAATLPPHSLSPDLVERMKDQATALARELKVVGLMNVQFAIQGKTIYVLEVNPRASRTVPFISKATGVPLAKIAALCMVGKTLRELNAPREIELKNVAVKESVFPFARFPGVDVILGPEMKSTGEVMGIAADYPSAFAKGELAAGSKLPRSGTVFISVKDDDKPAMVDLAKRLRALGFRIVATGGTHRYLTSKGIEVEHVLKVTEGRPHVVDKIVDGEIALVFNTTFGKKEIADSFSIRRESLMHSVPYYTTVQAARMAVGAIEALARGRLPIISLQDALQR